MKKALISTNEDVSYFDGSIGKRIAQVVEIGDDFPVHESLIWVDCEDDVTAEMHYWKDNTSVLIPVPVVPENTEQSTSGIQDL